MQSESTKSSERWLPELCSQLGSCQSPQDVQDTLDKLPLQLLANLKPEAVLKKLQTAKEPQRLVELLLSSGTWSKHLSGWLVSTFPNSVEDYIDSIHSDILSRLTLLLTFTIRPQFGRETDLILFQYRNRCELGPQVLRGLLSFSLDEPENSVDGKEGDAEFEGLIVGTKRKQAAKKQARKAKKTNTVTLNLRDLERLEIPEPKTRLEAYTTALNLLDDMKEDLSDLLELVQHPTISAELWNQFVVTSPTETPVAEEEPAKDQPEVDATAKEVVETPAAYPCVQPMKAALYFENAERFGEWRILISTRADRDLREARRSDRHFFHIVIKKIIELSHGHFSADNQKRLNGHNVDFPVFEAKMTRDSRLVYQIDCIPEYDDSNFERQVIKIFGVYTHAQIDKRFWNSMGHQLSRKGKTYRDRCKFRNKPHHTGDNVILPASFPPPEPEAQDTTPIPELPKEDLEEIHSLLVLEKFVTLSKELLKSIVIDLDVAHVFDVTRQEKEIIEHPNSCYVLGRSGTGKTTTMLFKMLGIERAYDIQSQASETAMIAKPRQLFVTQSRVLATRVEEYFAKLLDSLAAAKKSKDELMQIAEHKKQQQEESNLLYDVDDDVTWKASLPDKFSLLQDEHFPLFLTYERLSQLLEGDLDSSSYLATTEDSKGHLISYETFTEKYWPHLPQDLTKNLDPALVFSELLGVIEGSEQSLNHETRYLDQKSYKDLSHRAQHVFAKQRDKVYALFVAYLKAKRQNGDYDVADRTHRILKAFETRGVPGTKIDYLYVDEAQDNLLVDAMLLRSLCRNPNGLFWAGDTAQTIAIGSSFRFNDLKAFLYRLEERREQRRADNSGITQGELKTFQLAVNYRSHGGIVRCATAVIDLITHFWPYAIDSMAPEEGVVDGAKPVFFSGWDTDNVRYEQFLFGDSGERIEFGARQCILVRDEAARSELRRQVGDIGLILTLYESKGLEFDDVLLYKFFEDSKIDLGQWRLVLNMVEKDRCKGISAPRFDEERHAGVCAELKFLYVAITRSRKNLWIVDCSEKAEPMKLLWESRGFIQHCVPGGDVPRLAVSSTPDEWANTGRTLFTNRRYLQAMHAFERANLPREAKISHTHFLRETARHIQPTNKENIRARRDAFCAAATSFVACAKSSKGKEQRVYYHNAGNCFEQAGSCGDNAEDYGKAAQAYELAKEYTSAVKLYKKADQFDEAVNVVQEHRHEVDSALAESVLEVARFYYFKNQDFKKAKTLFDSVEEELQYLEDNILLDECHAAVLADLGRYQEAADIHIEEGRTMEAIQVLLEDTKDSESIVRAKDYILHGLWQKTSFSQKIKPTDTDARKLLKLASKVNPSLLSATQQDEIVMFQTLERTADVGAEFRRLAYAFLKRDEKSQALLCFDHYFIHFPPWFNIPTDELAAILEDFLVYAQLFKEIAHSLDVNDESTQRLFNIEPTSIENSFRLRPDTWLFKKAMDSKAMIMESDEEGIVVSASELLNTLKNALWGRLAKRMFDENEVCQKRAPQFTPCLPFIMNSECHRISCPRVHIEYTDLSQAWFNTQLRIHFLQILIVQVFHSIPSAQNTIPAKRYWIHRLYETIRPMAHYMGSQACVRFSAIPISAIALDTVKNWVRDILFTRDIPPDNKLLTFYHDVAELFLLLDRQAAVLHLERSPLLTILCDPKYPSFFRPGNPVPRYLVYDLYHCLEASHKTFTTAGIIFFERVMVAKLPMDINNVCHLADFLCGSIILARARFDYHSLTMPRGWFLNLLRQIQVRDAETLYLDRLLDSMKALLEALILGGEKAKHLLYESRDLSDMPAIRELFIARVCRALGLIGYNINNEFIRAKVQDAIKVVNTAKPHFTFRPFVWRGRFWGPISKAVRESYTDSQLDDMVTLCLLAKKNDKQRPPPYGVRRVFFGKPEDLPSLLSTGPMRADAPAFVPKGLTAKADDAAAAGEGEEAEEPAEQGLDQPDADVTDLVDSRNVVDALASSAAPVVGETISDDQKRVAAQLTAVYRQVLRTRKLKAGKSATQANCDVFFEACVKASADIAWPEKSFYRKLYLGLLPHVLVCLNAVETYAWSAKKKAKRRMRQDEKQDLEALTKRITELGTIVKTSKELHKQLSPTSKLHSQRDIEQLKRLVCEVEALLKRVPNNSGIDVQFHLDMAIKGIVTEKKPPKPEPKPDLNVGDLDGYLPDDMVTEDYDVA